MDLGDLSMFAAVARAGGFREAARTLKTSASRLSASVRRLEDDAGVRLLNRTTRSVVLTAAGAWLLDRSQAALQELATTADELSDFRGQAAGTLKLNVPVAAARLVLPPIINAFLRAHPEIRLELLVADDLVDMVRSGCDAGIRYEERLEQDMVAVPIGARRQRLATAASPEYLASRGRPQHPRELLGHSCLRHRFPSGAMPPWAFEKAGEAVSIDPSGPLVVTTVAADVEIEAAAAGLGIVYLFEDWLRPALHAGTLEPVLEDWWSAFPGPYLYYTSRRHMPGPLRAFVDFIKNLSG